MKDNGVDKVRDTAEDTVGGTAENKVGDKVREHFFGHSVTPTHRTQVIKALRYWSQANGPGLVVVKRHQDKVIIYFLGNQTWLAETTNTRR